MWPRYLTSALTECLWPTSSIPNQAQACTLYMLQIPYVFATLDRNELQYPTRTRYQRHRRIPPTKTVITSGKSTNQTAELIVLHLILIRIFNVFPNPNYGKNRQPNKHIAWTYSILMILSNFSSFCSYCLHCLLSKMEKPSSRGHALEHLESSGIQVLMNGPNIRNLCTGRKRELNMDPWRYFKAFHTFNCFFKCQFTA